MRNPKWTAGAAALCAIVGLSAISATAANAAGVSDCLKSARDVRTAIENSQDSARLGDAKRQQRSGLGYCSHGLYKQGLAHYASALEILGAGEKRADRAR